jgi:hypothetical protein
MGVVVNTGKDRLCKPKQNKRKPSIFSYPVDNWEGLENDPDTRYQSHYPE